MTFSFTSGVNVGLCVNFMLLVCIILGVISRVICDQIVLYMCVLRMLLRCLQVEYS